MSSSYVRYGVKVAIIGAVYFATAKIGLSLHPVSGFATFVWPPTGIALASLVIFGYRYWPGIFLAAFLINIVTGAPTFVAIGIGIGNTLEPLCGAFLLKRFARFQPSLERVTDVIGLVVFAAIFSTAISATIGSTSLLLGGTIHASTYGKTWLAWWTGDMLGDLVFAPLILVWSQWKTYKLRRERIVEAAVLSALLVGVSSFVFRGSLSLGLRPFALVYTIFPILIWIALRFGQRASVTAIATVSIIATWGTIVNFMAGGEDVIAHEFLLLQSFVGITAVTFMIISAFVSERDATQKRQLELVRKTVALSRQHARLLALNQAKDEFISLASHQLRTPPTVVKQYSGMLLENYAGKLNKDQRDMVNRIYSSNERQIKVIDNLLHVTQMDIGMVEIHKERVDLVELIDDLLHDRALLFSSRQQNVAFSHKSNTVMASVDKIKLGMALENIIDNASNYTPEGKNIAINASRAKNNVIVTVKDEGVGIAKKETGKLFKKFTKIQSQAPISVGGTGLGLYWSKKIILMHGGSIEVVSEPNVGSTFTVTIPAN